MKISDVSHQTLLTTDTRGIVNKIGSTMSEPLLSEKEKKKNSYVAIEMRKTNIRFFALAMAALLMFGNNYSFDNPQALQTQIMNELNITSPQYNLLYSAFSFPNIFLTLAGGFMIDFLGVRVGIFCFCFGVLLSQFVVALGGAYKNYMVMLLGRAVFGVCSENLIIAQSAIVAKWFKGAELSTAIGIIMTVPEIASALNSLLSPIIYEKYQELTYPLFFSVFICIFSGFCAIILILLDRKADKQSMEGRGSQEGGGHHEQVSFNDIKQFSATFWILVLLCMMLLGIYIPFLDDANDFFQQKFKFTSVEAGKLLMIPYLTSTVVSPFIGKFVDKIGQRRSLIGITCLIFISSQFLFALLSPGQDDKPNMFSILPLVLLGTSFAFYSCVIIPSVQYVVEQRVMGTAFGIMGMLESVALSFFPVIAATIVTSSDDEEIGYSNVGFFYAGIGCLAILLGLSLFFFDKKGSVILDFINPESPNEREKQLLNKYKKEDEEDDGEDEDDEDDDEDDEDEEEEGKSLNILEDEEFDEEEEEMYKNQIKSRSFTDSELAELKNKQSSISIQTGTNQK